MRTPVAHGGDSSRRKSAYFDPEHPLAGAAAVACPTCGAGSGAPCTATIGTFGSGAELATRTPIRGLHAARMELGAS